MERLGTTCIVRFGAGAIEARCTGYAQYETREPSFLMEWVDTTGRPCSHWVEAGQIVAGQIEG